MSSYDKILSFEIDIYKQLYEESKQRRNQINNKLAPTIAIFTAEITGITWMIFEFINNMKRYENFFMLHHLFSIVTIILSVCFWIMGTSLLVLCLTNYKFTYFNPIKFKESISENKKYLEHYTQEEILNNIKIDISNAYQKMCVENWTKTNEHSSYLKNCYICLVITLIFMIISFILVVLLDF